uniref:Putative conserved secreted protein n=1 Tax=Ixodes ricinus TaxID=34613 RepID=A0A147BQM7_IXORI
MCLAVSTTRARKREGTWVLQTFVLPVGATCLAHPQQIGKGGGHPASPTAAVGTLRGSWGPPFISASSPLLHPGVCVSPLSRGQSSGSRDSSWVSSPRSQFQSPRFGGGVDSYVKDSMVEDPWAALELQRPAKVRAPRDAGRPSPIGDLEQPAVSATTDPASLKTADGSESTDLRDLESTDLQPTDSMLKTTDRAALPPPSVALSDDSKPL